MSMELWCDRPWGWSTVLLFSKNFKDLINQKNERDLKSILTKTANDRGPADGAGAKWKSSAVRIWRVQMHEIMPPLHEAMHMCAGPSGSPPPYVFDEFKCMKSCYHSFRVPTSKLNAWGHAHVWIVMWHGHSYWEDSGEGSRLNVPRLIGSLVRMVCK